MNNQQRSTDLGVYFPALDGIRCLAVFMVMFHHWVVYAQIKEISAFLGMTGVTIFFTLSGFLIGRILLVQRVHYHQTGWSLFATFYGRRMLRIFPLYFAVLIIGLTWAFPGARENWARLATFTMNIPGSDGMVPSAGIYAHFWSLSVEEQFYIVFPFLLMLTPRRYLSTLFIVMIFFGISTRIAVHLLDVSLNYKQWITNTWTIACLDSFGWGGLLAWYFCCRQETKFVFFTSAPFFIVTFLLLAAVIWGRMQMPDDPAVDILIRVGGSLFAVWLIAGIIYNKIPVWIKKLFSNRVLVYLGKISFGLYVIHPFVSWGVHKMGLHYAEIPYSILVYAIIYTIITIGIAALSWHLFESPFLKLKKKLAYKKEGS